MHQAKRQRSGRQAAAADWGRLKEAAPRAEANWQIVGSGSVTFILSKD